MADLTPTTTTAPETLPETLPAENSTADPTSVHRDRTAHEANNANPFWKPRPPPLLGPDGQPLSRNATKKLLKQQQYLEQRPQMRLQEKLKRKQKHKERREAIESGLIAPPTKKHKLDQVPTGITVGIDMSFDDLMLDKEVKSMVDQIKRCYAFNRSSDQIVHLALTSFTGTSRDEFRKRANGHELWRNFTMHEKPLEEVWPSKEIPGKDRLADMKRLQVAASIKSEAAKAKVLAANAASEVKESTTGTVIETAVLSSSAAPSLPEEAAAEGPLSGNSTIAERETTQESSQSSSLVTEYQRMAMARQIKEENLATIPAVDKVVYLSADSPNMISQLDPGTCYILGGIVDKNRFPNLCQEKAEKLGLETAQLPIGEYIQMSSRRILTVNQVFEILLQFIELKDWKEAFLKVIPQRKLEEKQRLRRGTEAWKAKYGEEGKARPSGGGGPGSGSVSVASSTGGQTEDEDEEEEEEEDENRDQ